MMPQIKKILYATDLSANLGYVLRYAVDSAQKHGAKIVILHVLEEASANIKGLVETELTPEERGAVREDKIAYAQGRIQDRIQAFCKKELKDDPEAMQVFEPIELVEGYPADQILSKAGELDCDIIVMGTHGKGFLRHSYFGSTAKKVIRRSRKPVLVVPLPKGKIDTTFEES